MSNKIEELSVEELGQLFPIEIVPYNTEWPISFQKEEELLKETLSDQIAVRIEHFGSTAVPGLAAKPTIDILIEIPILTDELKNTIIEKMNSIGYDFIWRADDPVPYAMFAKGYTLEGIKKQSFHIHMAEYNHTLWDRLYFRNYLRQDLETLKEYAKLKIELSRKYKTDREAYTEAKTDFINTITTKAKKFGST